ncbi:zinc ribbon domain-containing protein [Microcoleus sp. CAWBG51]|uniref:zinc ribbon domain-containing protein n=1 Tax=unclassified Microcoleus TaxID=2642155 RepID=UPI003444CC51
MYGSKLVIVDRWFPSSKTCSNCGTKKDTLFLSERVFECSHCGKVIDRDLNAAINLSKTVS